jgi:signal transduction histidine kinase
MVVVTVAYLAIVIVGTIYPLISPLDDYLNPPTLLEQGIDALVATTWLVLLLVSMARQPTGRMWKLIFLVAATSKLDTLGYVPNSVVWSIAHLVQDVGPAFYIHLVLAFPSGSLRTRFDRFVVGLAYAFVLVWSLLQLLLGGEWVIACTPECVRNVFVIWQDRELYDWLRSGLTLVAVTALFPLVLWALWRHWRDAGPAGRRTLLPLVVGVPLIVAVITAERLTSEFDIQPAIAFFDSPSGLLIMLLAPLVLPVGLLAGVLRTRLSRVRVASLVVELGRGVPVGGLRDVLARALDDPSLQLAFAAPAGSGFVDASGQPVELPLGDPSRTVTRLEREDELLGVLVHDPAIEAEDPGLVEAVGNAARLALENERLAAEVRAQLEEVRASRARIVEAADAERRRVERDLHDGAQQRLVALALRLQVASRTTPDAAALLEEATGELQTAIGEVRGLARGVHPTILTEAGLRAAVDALAERTPLPVTVDIPERRFDRLVEATAYFVVAEALTNVARYAAAGEARVAAAEDGGRLVVTVTDDGRGGADPMQGSGLRGLADRLAAIDGTLTVASPPGGGTLVRAELPLEAPTRAVSATPPPPTDPSPLAMVRAVPEARAVPGRRRRVRLSSPVVLIVVAAGLILVVSLAAAVPGLEPRPPIGGRADGFVRPFAYQVPPGGNVVLYPKSDHLHVLSPPPGDMQGISIWAVNEVLVDQCPGKENEPPGPVRARQPGVDGLLDYLRAVDGLHIDEIGARTVDSRPAVRFDLTVDEDWRCPRDQKWLLLWRDTSPEGQDTAMQVYGDGRVPLTLLDVDGATIAIEIWSGASDRPDLFDPWLETAEGIVDSIRFFHRPPDETSPAIPISSP